MEALARGLRGGVPIVDLLRTLASHGGRTGRAVRSLSAHLEGGVGLAEAWSRSVRNHGVAARLLLDVAEETGDTEGACVAVGRLDAELLRLRAAMVGPLVRPLLSVVAACFLLPVPTAVLGSAGAYALEVGLSLAVVVGVTVLTLFGLRALTESPARVERLLDLPFGRDVDRWLLATIFEATLRAGTPPVTVLGRLAEASTTVPRRARFAAARGVLEHGGAFTDAVALLGVFDATARLEIRAGEESGELDAVFRGVAADSGERLARRLKLAATIVTFVVGFLILGGLALRILASFREALGGTEDILEKIDAETPIRLLNGLQGR